MTFPLLPLVIALGQVSAASGSVAGWKLSGRFVQQQAVEDARCAVTLDELCRALGVEHEGFLEIRDGEVRYRGDGVCWNLPFRAERVNGDMAEGAFESPEPDGSAPKIPCAGRSCSGRRVQIWREDDTLKVLGPMETLGACAVPDRRDELKTSVVRFVPEAWLTSAATEQAARLGVDLRRCNYKTERGAGPPRPCALSGGERLLKLTGISSEYCPDEPVIRMRVENVSATPLWTSVTVERLDDSRRWWHEYSADVFGTRPFPRQVITKQIPKDGSLEIRWRPRAASNARRLDEGVYRIVAHATVALGEAPLAAGRQLHLPTGDNYTSPSLRPAGT